MQLYRTNITESDTTLRFSVVVRCPFDVLCLAFPAVLCLSKREQSFIY
uniref:Uncharacterized protein n=1 Tax=Anguilla anguilla TaxID=7936 RepID=A0A0E9QLX8_ANGAN